MLFNSNRTTSWLRTIRGFFWPTIGWRRASSYAAHRLRRLSASPHSIAAGLACGAAVSFTPFVGFHFVLAFVLCFFVRGSLLAGAVGTALGNPWTFPFIWLGTLGTGQWLLGEPVTPARSVMSLDMTLSSLSSSFSSIFVPMLIGSVPFAILTWWVVYGISRPLVDRYQARRRAKALERARRIPDPPPATAASVTAIADTDTERGLPR